MKDPTAPAVKENATAGVARMNIILHDYAIAEIKQGNTLANPLFLDGISLKTFDYVVRCGALLLCCQRLRHRFDLLGSPTRIDAAVAVLYQLYPCDS
jgi:hypothetical protein